MKLESQGYFVGIFQDALPIRCGSVVLPRQPRTMLPVTERTPPSRSGSRLICRMCTDPHLLIPSGSSAIRTELSSHPIDPLQSRSVELRLVLRFHFAV